MSTIVEFRSRRDAADDARCRAVAANACAASSSGPLGMGAEVILLPLAFFGHIAANGSRLSEAV